MNYDNKEEMFPIVDEQGNITGLQPVENVIMEVNCYIR